MSNPIRIGLVGLGRAGNGMHRGEIRALADHFLILRRAVRASQRAIMNGLQQVRLARAVLAEEDIHPRVGRDLQVLIVAEVP